MPYQLKIDRPLIEAVRKEGDKQLRKAAESIREGDDLEEAVHDLRKRMKKVRALLRLVRPGLEKTYQIENKACRDVARPFSEIRDAQVLPTTIARLRDVFAANDEARQLFKPLEAWGDAHRQEILDDADLKERRQEAADTIEKIRERFHEIELDCAPEKALRKGVAKSYGRARDGLSEAIVSSDAELLHDWRKRLKYHWYHMRLLRDIWPDAMDTRIAALDRLTDILGTDHDLVVLLERLRADDPDGLTKEARRGLEVLLATHSTSLRVEAFRLAPLLLVEKPRAHGRRMAGLWRVANAASLVQK
ncbi:CHAD domain-containing protein [Notoacmeibacter ruber]|uniref:CHAD domain-containing protein n=1 Tax=Notoacmeibacter ruber TaxID=2670375 RepID=A0A3L7J949_9HYPH|nr:CHAD domain-containing protein [Notoacmeibacter ruber]RLQ86895.1 CHAD domain-containing protein [Notoacmeibacter ruber]